MNDDQPSPVADAITHLLACAASIKHRHTDSSGNWKTFAERSKYLRVIKSVDALRELVNAISIKEQS